MGMVLYIQCKIWRHLVSIGRVLLVYVFVCCRARDNKGERTFSTQTELSSRFVWTKMFSYKNKILYIRKFNALFLYYGNYSTCALPSGYIFHSNRSNWIMKYELHSMFSNLYEMNVNDVKMTFFYLENVKFYLSDISMGIYTLLYFSFPMIWIK